LTGQVQLTEAQLVPIMVLQEKQQTLQNELRALRQGLNAVMAAYAKAEGLPDGPYSIEQRGEHVYLSLRSDSKESE